MKPSTTAGVQSIDLLQQAYGFDTNVDPWEPKPLFDAFAQAYPGVDEVGALLPGKVHYACNTWKIGDLHVTAGSHSPIFARAEESGVTALVIHYAGSCEVTQEGTRMVLTPYECGMLLVNAKASARTGFKSSISIEVQVDRVEDTARTMFGMDAPVLRLYPNLESFDAPEMRRYIAQLPLLLASMRDAPRQSQDTLERLLARLLTVEPAGGKRSRRQLAKHVRIDQACAYMMERIHEEITLSDLERVSLMSARMLQASFRARFGISPMHWLLQRRLERAFRLIRGSGLQMTVSAAARESGFRHMGRFAAAFRQRFGVLPSELAIGSGTDGTTPGN